MSLRRSIQLSFALLSTLAACHSPKSFTPSLWFYRSYDADPTKYDSLVNRFSYLELESDSSFTQDFGHFYYGKWRLRNDELYLTNQHHVTFIYTLPFIQENQLGFRMGKDMIAIFQRQPPPGSSSKNPFSLDNNRWLIPAAHKENIAEIRQRLLSHFHFWELYFKWGSRNNINAIDTRDIPTPLKIYGNGFGLLHYSDLSPRWKSCFFDSVDCRTADTLIKGIFRRNQIKWPSSDDQGEMFVSGIQQVEDFLRQE